MKTLNQWCQDLVKRLVEAERDRQRMSETVRQLQALDGRALRDLGIDPSEIRSAAAEAAGAVDATRLRFVAVPAGGRRARDSQPVFKEIP